MFEAVLKDGNILKKLVDAIQMLCKEVNFECTEEGMQIQAMDASHVALVSMQLKSVGEDKDESAFESFRCDKPCTIGVSTENLVKVFKLCDPKDKVRIVAVEREKAEDEEGAEEGETKPLKKEPADGETPEEGAEGEEKEGGETNDKQSVDIEACRFTFENEELERCVDFEMKLVDLEDEDLGIPDQEYNTEIVMPSAEYKAMCNNLSNFGDTVQLQVTKEGATFKVDGDIGKGSVVLKPRKAKVIEVWQEVEKKDGEKEEEEEDMSLGDGKEQKKVKKEQVEKTLLDTAVVIDVEDPVNLSFALRYLKMFSNAAPLCSSVCISLSDAVPMVVSFRIGLDEKHEKNQGFLNFYLAPKIDE